MQLLVSVRSPEEAREALAGGAGLIDIKEPRHGALGRAPEAVIAAVVASVAGATPVSAAMGELAREHLAMILPDGLAYVKWGLAGWAHRDWQTPLLQIHQQLAQPIGGPRLVVTAYADASLAHSPPVSEVLEFVCQQRMVVLLLDTFCKEVHSGRPATLLDWLTVEQLEEIRNRCRAQGVRLALAGSLRVEDISTLKSVRPDWFAVRGAVCAGHDRAQTVSAALVHHLAQALRQARSAG